MDIDKLKKEIERVEYMLTRRSGQFIKPELKKYLKLLRKQLKQAKKE